MTNHCTNVMDLMAIGGKWKEYDLGFRHMIQNNLNKWGEMNVALWTKALPNPKLYGQSQKSGQNQKSFSLSQSKNKPPKGYCFDHHLQANCTRSNCPYNHRCHRCSKGFHSASECRSQMHNTQTEYKQKDHGGKTNEQVEQKTQLRSKKVNIPK